MIWKFRGIFGVFVGKVVFCVRIVEIVGKVKEIKSIYKDLRIER